jgi:peptidoglycan/LPS O-acetylase OafA/YrhL
MFAAGILVYHALNYPTKRQFRWTIAVLGLGTLYGAADRFLSNDPIQMHLGEYLCVAALFALALLYLRRWDDTVSNHWSVRPLLWCGQRSYSIYLTHYPLVVVFSSAMALAGFTSELSVALIVVPTCVALSLPIAWLFHRMVEQRFLNASVDAK